MCVFFFRCRVEKNERAREDKWIADVKSNIEQKGWWKGGEREKKMNRPIKLSIILSRYLYFMSCRNRIYGQFQRKHSYLLFCRQMATWKSTDQYYVIFTLNIIETFHTTYSNHILSNCSSLLFEFVCVEISFYCP